MSVYINQTNATPGTAYFSPVQPSYLTTWSTMTSAATTTATLSTIQTANLRPTSIVLSAVQVDDQQGGGAAWLLSASPGSNNLTFTLGGASSSNSQLGIAWSIQQY
jgi:hypothetical protein